jgi:hypothetical protein
LHAGDWFSTYRWDFYSGFIGLFREISGGNRRQVSASSRVIDYTQLLYTAYHGTDTGINKIFFYAIAGIRSAGNTRRRDLTGSGEKLLE